MLLNEEVKEVKDRVANAIRGVTQQEQKIAARKIQAAIYFTQRYEKLRCYDGVLILGSHLFKK